MNSISQQQCQHQTSPYRIETQLHQQELIISLYQKYAKNLECRRCVVSAANFKQNLESYFNNFSELSDHLIKDEGYSVNADGSTLVIFVKVGSKKLKLINILELPLKLVEMDYRAELEAIMTKFSPHLTVTQSETKSSIRMIASILSLYINHQDKPVKNDIKSQLEEDLNVKLVKNNHENQERVYKQKYEQIKLQLQQRVKQIEQLIPQRVGIIEFQIQKINEICKKEHQKLANDMLLIIEHVQGLTAQIQQIPKFRQKILLNLTQTLGEPVEKFDMEAPEKGIFKDISEKNYDSPISEMEKWIAPESKNFNKLTICDNIIVTEKSSAQILSRVKIDGKYKFTVKMHKITKYIKLGVKGIQDKKRQRDKILKNLIAFSNNGICQTGIQEVYTQKKLHDGQQVTIAVNRHKGRIKWFLGNEELYQVYHVNLGDADIDWVPYIFLSRDCCIEVKLPQAQPSTETNEVSK